jgi:hypothetical protein
VRNSASYEILGGIAYGFITPISPTLTRTSGWVKGDFTIALFEPPPPDGTGADIAGSTSIVVAEFGSTGAYRFAVALPSSPAGNYTLSVTDPDGQVHSCVFMAYVTRQGDTGDGSAQLELWIYAANGSPISGRVIGDLTSRIYDPTMTPYAGSEAPRLDELAPGHYMYGFDDTDSAPGDWFFDILDPTYFPLGQQGTWLYLSATAEVAGAPSLTAGVNDGTGTSVTLSYIADNPLDTIYTYYRALPSGAWSLSGDTRVGSGDVQITGPTNNRKYEFLGVASRSGSAVINQSPPSVTIRIYVTDNVSIFDSIRDALYDWVDSQTALTIIWIPANAPMPEQPYITLRMRPVRDVHRDYHTPPDDSGWSTIFADREFIFEVEVYGDIHPAAADSAMTEIERIKSSLQTRVVIDALTTADIAIMEAMPTQDLSAIGRTDHEARYMFEARFGITLEHTEEVGIIETSDAPTGTYG